MGLLLFRARDKIKTGDGCWAESRSSIPGNRRGLLGCGVDFFIALLERQASFSARTIRSSKSPIGLFENFFHAGAPGAKMFAQEKAPSSKAPGRTTITMHDKRLVCASDRRSGIAPASLFRRATGLKLRTRQRNTERGIRGERSSKGQEVERKRDPLRRTDRASETA